MASFNLWEKGWIEVETEEGIRRVNLREAFTDAHRIKALSAHSPEVVVGTHRILVAILQDALQPGSVEAIADLWLAGRFPANPIESFASTYGDRFDLFSETAPFLQTTDVAATLPEQLLEAKKKGSKKLLPKSVGNLSHDFPTGTSTNHFHHIWEEDIQFCYPCCAATLPVAIPFANGGGAGMFLPAVNPSAYFIIPSGDNLFQSLVLSLLPVGSYPSPDAPDIPFWKRETPVVIASGKEVNNFGYLQSLTYPIRRVHLYPEKVSGRCSRCGEEIEEGVRSMIFTGGERRTVKTLWPDPFVAFRKSDDGMKPVTVNPGRSFLREFLPAFLGRNSKRHLRPAILDGISRLQMEIGEELPTLRFQAYGVQFEKAKTIFWNVAGLEVPPKMLTDIRAEDLVEKVMALAESASGKVFGAVDAAVVNTPFESKVPKKPSFLATQAQTEFWQLLAGPLRQIILNYDPAQDHEVVLDEWRRQVQRIAFQTVRRRVTAFGNSADGLWLQVSGMLEIAARFRQGKSRRKGTKTARAISEQTE